MNLPLRSINLLNSSGFEAALWFATRPANAPFSTENEYVMPTRDPDFVLTFSPIAEERFSNLQVRAEYIGTNAIGTNGIVALLQLEAELESGVSIGRSRIPASGGGTVRQTASLDRQ